ncbi:MAG: tRNA lysidine(34) synthetase TilS [Marinilabiliales bacterium]|nr:MAG: tRNA lysidine(34) synthetase TilS [Marinilabiliales bacterium]
MEKDFLTYIESVKLCKKSDRILLGISGGIDSICMFHLFRMLNYPIGIAHCNFQLRGTESDEDEIFVKNLANEFDIPFFSVKFNTKEVAKEEGISIQMAARDLRYDWFEELKQKYDYDYIAIAHNQNDVVETFLINLTRGSGIKGLTGIKPKLNSIIRPLLFASRQQLLDFLEINNFEYHEDSSNQSTKYSRNLIRHEIVPLFEKLNPKFQETLIENISKLRDTELIYKNEVKRVHQSIITENKDKKLINIEELKNLYPISAYLFELLRPYGFTSSQVTDIVKSIDGVSGKQFYSSTHRLIKDRSDLIIEENTAVKIQSIYIDHNQDSIEFPLKLEFNQCDVNEDFEIRKDRNIGQFDFDKLEFPLVLRKWQSGDYFMPLGMSNLKKVSDFFIDQKLSITEKESAWILESKNKIVWIIGHRIDERFKITNFSKTAYEIDMSK